MDKSHTRIRLRGRTETGALIRVSSMDIEWVRERLEAFLQTCVEHERKRAQIPAGDYWHEGLMRSVANQVEDQVATVRRIVEALDPSLLNDEFGVDELYGGMTATIATVRQALGLLRDKADLEVKLAPTGPTLAATGLHPWIWGAANQFWDAGHIEVAVEQAAKSLNARIQQRSGLKMADRELAAEVFSAKESAKTVRLWLPGDRATDTWRSRQDGLHHLAMGAFAGIRNVLAHSESAGWSSQEALEYLAVLSAVARWVDETEPVLPP